MTHARLLAWRGVNAATGARAAVRYTPQPWGTELEASVSGIPPGTRCQIWATTATGQHATGGSWTVTSGAPHAWYPASVPFPAASLTGFDVTTGGTVVVAIPLRPGTPPTRSAAARFPPLTRAKASPVVIEQARATYHGPVISPSVLTS